MTDTHEPYIDVDEWREQPRPHRYVHGGFENTHTRFSFYFPPADLYKGRFFQYLEGGGGGHEDLLASGTYAGMQSFDWVFDLVLGELGGYLVESNQGHFPGESLGFGNDYERYGASADVAVFGRSVAAETYGGEPRHGYVWGISGGGARSGWCLEERPDVWQGGVPHSGLGQSTQWSPWGLLWLVARDKFDSIIDATEPGGSGDPFAGLSDRQREALAEFYRRGFPRGAESQLAPFRSWASPFYTMLDRDPEYFSDFWNEPGYAGHDNPAAFESLLLRERTTITRIVPASEVGNALAFRHTRVATAAAAGADPTVGVQIAAEEPERAFMSTMRFLTGKAVGREVLMAVIEDGIIGPFGERAPDAFDGVVEGDEVEIDNRDFIAFCYYHRYAVRNAWPEATSVVEAELEPWALDGIPIFPQRERHPINNATPTRYKAYLDSKMIYVQMTHDAQVWPTTIFPYERQLRERMGSRADDHFRLWFVENSPHGAPEVLCPLLTSEKDPGVWRSRLVPYGGVTAEALRQVVAWVEDDVPPLFYSGVHLTRDNRLVLPATAAERGGVQPVVALTVDGGQRCDVSVGSAVEFAGTAEQPAGAGSIVSAEWDFLGTGEFRSASIEPGAQRISIEASHSYSRPGTYFASFRVAAHPAGSGTAGPVIFNLARVRVVVK